MKTPTPEPWEILSTPEFLLYDRWIIFNKVVISKFVYDAFGKRIWKREGRLATLQSLLTLKKWTVTFNFQMNESSSKFIRASLPEEPYMPKWISQSSYRMGLSNMHGRGRGLLPFVLFWLLKSELELSISSQKSPLLSLYEHPFHKNHTCRKSITYNASLRTLGDDLYSGFFFIWPLNYF